MASALGELGVPICAAHLNPTADLSALRFGAPAPGTVRVCGFRASLQSWTCIVTLEPHMTACVRPDRNLTVYRSRRHDSSAVPPLGINQKETSRFGFSSQTASWKAPAQKRTSRRQPPDLPCEDQATGTPEPGVSDSLVLLSCSSET